MPSRPKQSPAFRIEFPPELPISARADEIIGLLQRHQVLVLAGETGSGKTTQIPKMCLAAGGGTRGRIACTQPRRVAAASVSRRVAEELNVPYGREVGCKIRFADQTSDATVIKFMTDGMLLAELQSDPLLREYDTIIVDEAHERSLNIDFILGHLRRLRHRRPELRIVITSATIDTEAFAAAFDGAPVVEVSGRVFPVEVIYAPIEEMGRDGPPGRPQESAAGPTVPPYQKAARSDEYTYIDAAEEAVERVLQESHDGDVLVFLPTERDIRELTDLIDGKRLRNIEVVPLFGRLTNAEQQRVFAPTQRRKVVLATNIAETSLTIPGIRFVIDTGLARLSRYVPQSRTRRLPVEPVAQSSANQRKGRCGRVRDGVCIRLYAEQDFNDRPRFAQPEIQRSNLADVILRMKAFGLGDIEEFPFLNTPPAKGIRAGYGLLEELGAIVSEVRARPGQGRGPCPLGAPGSKPDNPLAAGPAVPPSQEWQLTDLGRELAHLPVDPTIARMILQARSEKALREVLIIAAALSIQDPRERPLDQQQKADAAHRRFTHPDSDFLTLLAIWEAYHDEFETMSLGKLRKFCTAHFLSFLRMREWRDVHAQIEETIHGRDGFGWSSVYDGVRRIEDVSLALGTPAYRAIHRSILAGLLGNIATRADDGQFLATHDRKVAVFPGSALFEKKEMSKGGAPSGRAFPAKAAEDGRPGKRVARWLMAAEIMETGRMYARTCARIDPHWPIELGAHIIRATHSEPFWNAEAGRVLVKERRRIYNLELETRAVGYGKINPAEATEIFIREGLVGDTVTWPLDFLAHNRRLREKTEAVLTRTRSAGYLDLDEAAYRYYAARLKGETVSSVPELIDLVRHRQMTEPKFLFMADADLQPPAELAEAAKEFPETLPLANTALPLDYAYKPGQADDGVTLRVAVAEAAALTPAVLDWAVPGHLREKIELRLKALPKEQRRLLIPLTETAQNIAAQIGLIAARPVPPTLVAALAEMLTARLGVRIDERWWADKPLPEHLCVRVEVVDGQGRVLAASRSLDELRKQLGAQQQQLSQRAADNDNAAWRAARAKWEQPPALEWKFGDLPAAIVVSEHAGVPVRAYPGLTARETGVAVRLFATEAEAQAATRGGLPKLFEAQLRYELGWLGKDLRDLRTLGALTATLAPVEQMQQEALATLGRWVCARTVQPLQQSGFERELAGAKQSLRGLVPTLVDWLRETLTVRLALQTHPTPYPGMAEELAALVPADVLARTPFERLKHLPRYLRAMQQRADRWKRDQAKDAQRAKEIAPLAAAIGKLGSRAGALRWMLEEFRVSLFAQELGTAESVSAVRLEKMLREAGDGEATSPVAVPPAKPVLALPAKGRTVLKSFGSLGNLSR